jgi:hypothetical protein
MGAVDVHEGRGLRFILLSVLEKLYFAIFPSRQW